MTVEQAPRTGREVSADAVLRRALTVWPGLDTRKLRRTCGDPHRVARLVGRRTSLSVEAIVAILERG